MKNNELERLEWSGWPLPDEYLTELGRISALWATLENFLSICIGKLAGFDELADPKPFILVTHSSFPQKLDMLSSLCSVLEKERPRLARHVDVVAKLRSAQKSRNKYLHNSIGPSEDGQSFQIAQGSARGKLKTSVEPISIAGIRRATIEIDAAFSALYGLVLGRELGPVWERRNA